MTDSKWAVSDIDNSEGVVHVEELMTATLEIFQECEQAPGPTRLTTILLKGPAPRGEDPPWSLAWEETEAPLCGNVHLEIDEAVQIEPGQREKVASLLVRDRGGKDYENEKQPAADRLRGGYAFAPSDAEDADYFGRAGVKRDKSIASVELIFTPKGKHRQRLFFLYPAPARQPWMYDEHTFKLSYVLTSGESTWKADGPSVKVPAYEFIADSSDSDALKEGLQSEYGTPAKKPPLHARDFVDLVTGLSPISIALRGLLPLVVAFINSKITPGQRYTILGAELICTLLSDRALKTFGDALSGGLSFSDLMFDGYEDVGIDRFIDAYEGDEGPIRVFTFDQLRLMLAAGRSAVDLISGQDGAYKQFDKLPLPLALYAIAALFGQAKHHFAEDVKNPEIMGRWACECDELPLHVQFFWATIYCQTGRTSGRSTLGQRGLEYHDIEWTLEDDAKYKNYEKYNANWRTASFRLVQASLGLPSLGGMGPPSVELPDLPSSPF